MPPPLCTVLDRKEKWSTEKKVVFNGLPLVSCGLILFLGRNPPGPPENDVTSSQLCQCQIRKYIFRDLPKFKYRPFLEKGLDQTNATSQTLSIYPSADPNTFRGTHCMWSYNTFFFVKKAYLPFRECILYIKCRLS